VSYSRFCDLHAQGLDTRQAQENAERADRLFWTIDHEFRRFQAFYA